MIGRRCSLVLVAVAALSLAGCQEPVRIADAPAADDLGRLTKLVQDLHTLAKGKPLPEHNAVQIAARMRKTNDKPDTFIDVVVGDAAFAQRVAPRLLLGGHVTKPDHPVNGSYTLKRSGDGEDAVLYLRAPCAPKAAVAVDPWWAPGTKVRVCPDAYRADVRGDDGHTCGALQLKPGDDDTCGCGPRLIFCAADDAMYRRMRRGLNNEVHQTIGHLVANDRPLAELFTTNETVRDRYVEAVYRRARLLAGEDPSLANLDGWGDRPKLAPRHETRPGQHAGILTTPSVVYGSDASRGVLRDFYDMLWCVGLSSSRVDTEKVLGLGVVDLRVGDGWKDLAKMPVCTDCHARLDYGMQFFKGFPSAYNGVDYRPAHALDGSGPLFGDNIDDERGVAPLTPKGFAELATGQDEFASCMTRRVVDHVFHGRQSPQDLEAVRQAYASEQTLKAMMKVALRRYAVAAVTAPGEGPALPAAAGREGGVVTLASPLRDALDTTCVDCHDSDDAAINLRGPTLPVATLRLAADRVAFGSMPKTPEGLGHEPRQRLVRMLVEAAFTPEEGREAAERYFLSGMRGRPAHEPYAALAAVSAKAGARRSSPWLLIENFVGAASLTYTPGFSATVGLEALASCKAAGKTGADLQGCVERASRPEDVLVGLP